MAKAQVSSICLLCKEFIEADTKAIYINKVDTTDEGYGRRWYRQEVKPNNLRIKHIGHTNPKGLLHLPCWEKMINEN